MEGSLIAMVPRHIAKTRRRIREDLKPVDAAVELFRRPHSAIFKKP